jgi:hypothetical protein
MMVSVDSSLPGDFSAFRVYAASAGLQAAVTPEAQNSDYESGVVRVGAEDWHIRTARNTPAKVGAFVAFWRRDAAGVTRPFQDDDIGAGLLVFVEQQGSRGVFRFTASHLRDLGVTSGVKLGKRGFRVYPGWCVGLGLQAAATQRAQAPAYREY